VDVSKPFGEHTFLDIERAALAAALTRPAAAAG
jgi:hypothetical protein